MSSSVRRQSEMNEMQGECGTVRRWDCRWYQESGHGDLNAKLKFRDLS